MKIRIALLLAAFGLSLSAMGQAPFTNIFLPGSWPPTQWWTNASPPSTIAASNAWQAVNAQFQSASNAFALLQATKVTTNTVLAIGGGTLTGNVTAPAFIGPLTGNASTATAAAGAAWLTGNQTITLSGDATGSGSTAIAITVTNMQGTNLANRAVYSTNANNGAVIDATKPAQLFVTNATYAVTGFSGLISGSQHLLSMTVSNSNSSPITWNGPPTSFYFGASSTNALSIAAGKQAVVSCWVWPNVRTNICNLVQQ